MVDELIQMVDRDPALGAAEKETTISMMGNEKHFTIYSAKPTIIKSLLDHDHFELGWARVLGENGADRKVGLDELKESSGNIVAIKGKMPIGTLNIKYKPRQNNHQSSIISTEGVDPSVFENN